MADKFIRHEYASKKIYNSLNDIISQNKKHKRRMVIFGAGGPVNIISYYLKLHGITIEAILDNDITKQGSVYYGKTVYDPNKYLSKFDDDFCIMILSSHEDDMIKQCKDLGYDDSHIRQILHYNETLADFSFSNREGFRELNQAEIRQHQINVLKHLKYLCETHGLRYWLCGGTLLGAVRHQGYIPWDDDIDVFVEMKDLKKLTELLKDDLDFEIASFVDEKINFCESCSYMYEMTSDLDVNNYCLQVSWGVGIDIFPMVGIPAEGAELTQYISKITKLNDNVWNKLYSKQELRKATTELMEFMSQYDFDECPNCGYILSRHFTKEILPANYYTKTTELIFEGEKYVAPAGYHEYLVSLYGEDYMIPPPVNEREPRHNYKAYVPLKGMEPRRD